MTDLIHLIQYASQLNTILLIALLVLQCWSLSLHYRVLHKMKIMQSAFKITSRIYDIKSQPMTSEQKAAFDKAFEHFNAGFDTMDEVFKRG